MTNKPNPEERETQKRREQLKISTQQAKEYWIKGIWMAVRLPFMSLQTHKARRNVLICTGLTYSVAELGLIPSKIPAIGIDPMPPHFAENLKLGLAVACVFFTLVYFSTLLQDLQEKAKVLLKEQVDSINKFRASETGFKEEYIAYYKPAHFGQYAYFVLIDVSFPLACGVASTAWAMDWL